MFAFIVYLISIIEQFRGLLGGIIVILLCVNAVVFLYFIIVKEDFPTLKDYWIKSLLAVSLLAVFIPTQQASYMIAAAYAAQTAVENPKAQILTGKIETILNNKLDEIIKNGSDVKESENTKQPEVEKQSLVDQAVKEAIKEQVKKELDNVKNTLVK